MRGKLRRWWPLVKALLGLAILVAVGRRFALDLQRPELWERPLRPGWLVLSGALYLLGMGLWAGYWRRLLGHLGARPPLGRALRAYYLGQLGKYLPGKAWAVLLRGELARGPAQPGGEVGLGLALLTAFYEVLTTMTSGALVAAVLFGLLGADAEAGLGGAALRQLLRLEVPPGGVLGRGPATALALLLAAATGLPLLPPLFNRVARRLFVAEKGDAANRSGAPPAKPQAADLAVGRLRLSGAPPSTAAPADKGGREPRVPVIRLAYLAEGLALTALGWLLLGTALAATLYAVLGPSLTWTPAALGRLPAFIGLAYVAGFVILVAPGGLGVREFFLTLLLAPELVGHSSLSADEARAVAVLAVLVLRLVWTAAELAAAGVLYWIRP
jgi:uncharacterized membrane protein YbhN (UPF0104 family)